MLCASLKDELDRHYYLKNSDVLTDEDRTLFTKMLHGQDDNIEAVSYTHLDVYKRQAIV